MKKLGTLGQVILKALVVDVHNEDGTPRYVSSLAKLDEVPPPPPEMAQEIEKKKRLRERMEMRKLRKTAYEVYQLVDLTKTDPQWVRRFNPKHTLIPKRYTSLYKKAVEIIVENSPRVRRIQEEVKRLEEKKKKLYTLYDRKLLSRTDTSRQLEELNRKVLLLNRELRKLQNLIERAKEFIKFIGEEKKRYLQFLEASKNVSLPLSELPGLEEGPVRRYAEIDEYSDERGFRVHYLQNI